MDNWGGVSASQSPLAANWSNHMEGQLPSTGWWKDIQSPFTYGQGYKNLPAVDYDPGDAGYSFSPISSLTHNIIDADINNFLGREFPELFDFTSGVQYGGVAGAGKVAQDPGFGQFSKHPEVYAEIQNAANKYGVPANFLQAIIAKESSGDWDSNSMVKYARGMRIFGYIGAFENAVSSWGFNFDSLIGNRAGQIEVLASGLRRFYDKLHTQNPAYGWANVAAYHYSGDPTMTTTPGDSYQHGTTQQYVNEALQWWKNLDAKAGNTWSNYTDTTQNTGVGSPQNTAWGPYAEYDQALVGLSANSGAPANMLKAVLRYGDERGTGYRSNFDQAFVPVADSITAAYRQTGDWKKALASAMGQPVNSPVVAQVVSYWDELNADMSGVFGGPPGATAPSNQMEAIWGGIDYGVSQENGEANSWTASHPDMYDYGYGLGITNGGHPGMDITFPAGQKLFSPVSGTVTIAGPNNAYRYYDSWSPNSGQVRILLDNGHELILGHMSQIGVKVGDRVAPGLFVGLSGGAGSGDHLHLEYRIPVGQQTSTGWQSVDPRAALSGQFTGFNQGAKTGLGYTQAMTFQNLMRAGASGMPIPSGPVYSQGGGRSSWNQWLRDSMLGNDPNRMKGVDYNSMYQSIGGGGTPTPSGIGTLYPTGTNTNQR